MTPSTANIRQTESMALRDTCHLWFDSGIAKVCGYLDLNALNQTSFAVNSQAIVQARMVVAHNILTDAAKIVRLVYTESSTTSDGASDADEKVIDLTASYNGSWMKLSSTKGGRTSAYGIGCVIDTVTGLVLDLAVLSSYCQACSCAEVRCGG